MNDTPRNDAEERAGCPAHGQSEHVSHQGAGGTTNSGAPDAAQPTPGTPPETTSRCPYTRAKSAVSKFFRPKSSREGIGTLKYIYWNAFYFILEALNQMLSRNPFYKVSWDQWPPP